MSDRPSDGKSAPNFIRSIIEKDIADDKYEGRVVTRFPPEPNGYLHIGHAKSICLNFGLATDFDGTCHLRFDDTNPETEDPEYVEAIKNDVRWLGYDWDDKLFHASDYFETLYERAEHLIETGKAYVDSQTDEAIRLTRGSVTEPGTNSPFRTRSAKENLDLFRRMRSGEFKDGEHVLRAKIDMTSPNMKMRDPLLYRIRHAHHYRTGDEWCIYPMYDFAHPLSDAIENITHSICTLEFENNRELYDWVLDNAWDTPRPYQYEFNRLNLDYTVMSKRKLLELVDQGSVEGWDDPRLPTIAGLRRRGITPESIRDFCDRVGVVRADSRVDIALLEYCIRNDLNYRAPRVMAVVDPLRVVITNYPDNESEELDVPYWPHDVPKEGSRRVPFGKVIYIERDDFREDPPRKFYRLAPGREVRLRYAYFLTCDEVVKDPDSGEVVELRCSYDPATRGGDAPDGRKVKATLHWVSEDHSVPAEFRLYDRLFSVPNPEETDGDWKDNLNPDSIVIKHGRVEPSVVDDDSKIRYQFERLGYFWRDPVESSDSALVFNRIVTLRDTWAKISSGGDQSSDSRSGRKKSLKAQDTVGTARAPEPKDKRLPALSPDQAKRANDYVDRFQLEGDDAALLASRSELGDFFDEAVAVHDNPRSIANWIIHEVLRELKDDDLTSIRLEPSALAKLVALIDDGTISGRIAKDVFAQMVESGESPSSIVDRDNLDQISDRSQLEPLVRSVVESFPDKAAEYRGGKQGLIGFFVGQVMRKSQGKANPEIVRSMLESSLEG